MLYMLYICYTFVIQKGFLGVYKAVLLYICYTFVLQKGVFRGL